MGPGSIIGGQVAGAEALLAAVQEAALTQGARGTARGHHNLAGWARRPENVPSATYTRQQQFHEYTIRRVH